MAVQIFILSNIFWNEFSAKGMLLKTPPFRGGRNRLERVCVGCKTSMWDVTVDVQDVVASVQDIESSEWSATADMLSDTISNPTPNQRK